jgi:hypothetical protein
MNYGSANQNNYQGSGVESKQTTTSYKGSINYGSQVYGSQSVKKQSHNSVKHGSMKYGSQTHGSYAIKTQGSQKHGSQTSTSNMLYKGSGSYGGSNKKYMSVYVFSATNYQSTNNNYCTKSKGSGKRYSETKNSGSHSPSQFYNIFSPTYQPTEQLPPIHQPPPPSYFPTSYMNIPKIHLSFDKNKDITIPPLSLSFQIKQGGNGWSIYTDLPSTLTNAVSAVTGLNKKFITNMRVSTQNSRRTLTAQFYFYYNITVPIQDINRDKNKLYTTIVYLLQYSIIDGTFTDYFKNMSMPINITSIAASPYTIVYPAKSTVQSTTIESNSNNHDKTLFYFYVVFGTLVSVAGISTVAYFVYKKRNMKNNAIKFRDSIPNPMQKQIQLANA